MQLIGICTAYGAALTSSGAAHRGNSASVTVLLSAGALQGYGGGAGLYSGQGIPA